MSIGKKKQWLTYKERRQLRNLRSAWNYESQLAANELGVHEYWWIWRQRGPDCGCQTAWTVARFMSAGLSEQVEGWRRGSERRTRGRRSTMTALSRTKSHKELWSNCAYNYGTDGGRSRRRRSILLLRLGSIAWIRARRKSERKNSDEKTTKQTTCTQQAANGTRQHDSGARRQILAGERGYTGPRLRLRTHTLTSVGTSVDQR